MASGACTSTNRTQQFSASRGRDNLWVKGCLDNQKSKLKYSWLEVVYTWPKLTQSSERSGWLWHTWLAMTSGKCHTVSCLTLRFWTRDVSTFIKHVTLPLFFNTWLCTILWVNSAKRMLTELKILRDESKSRMHSCVFISMLRCVLPPKSWEANAAIGRNVQPHHHNDEIGTLVLGLRTTSKRWCQRKAFQQLSYSAFLSSSELDQSYKLTSSSYRAFRDTHPFSKEVSISYLLSKIFLALCCEWDICTAMTAWKSLSLRVVAIVMAIGVSGATPVEGEQASSQGSNFYFAISFSKWSDQSTFTKVRTERRLGSGACANKVKRALKPDFDLIWFYSTCRKVETSYNH